MRILLAVLTALLVMVAPVAAKDLEIYFIDVEGGQATLIVSPSGQSLLVDAGWPGFNGRDQDRIVAAAKTAGIKQIDYLLMTHYHLDHVGGIPPLVEKIPVVTFIDHGSNTETGRSATALADGYAKVIANAKHIVVKPGDSIPLKGTDIRVVTARGEVIHAALPGGGKPNAACEAVQPIAPNNDENGKSIGFVLNYGKFRFLDLADLTWNKELDLVCPNNPIGKVDLFLVSHHGVDISNSPALVHGVQPKVAISNTGVRKGGAPKTWDVVRNSPGLKDFWQLHYSETGGKDHNVAEQFIANMEANCQGNYFKVVAKSNGKFTVTNTRNNLTRQY